jgi:DNA-binding transcriptional LysR family regulator
MDLLVTLVAAGESRTKAEAAEKLNISVSALEKRMRTLTLAYGVPLVELNNDELRLTEEGKVFYPSASRSVEYASLAEEMVRAHLLLKTNHILVGHSSYIPSPLLGLVHGLKFDSFPRVRVHHRADLTRSIARGVCSGEMIAGFGFLPLVAPELVIRRLWDEPLVVCIPSPHPIAKRSVIRPEDLDRHAFIAVSRGPMPGMHDEIEDYFRQMGVALDVVSDAFAPTEALNLVEQEVGICILSQSSAVQRRGVTVRPLWTQVLRRHSAFFYREDNRSDLMNELSRMVLDRASLLVRGKKPAGRVTGDDTARVRLRTR